MIEQYLSVMEEQEYNEPINRSLNPFTHYMLDVQRTYIIRGYDDPNRLLKAATTVDEEDSFDTEVQDNCKVYYCPKFMNRVLKCPRTATVRLFFYIVYEALKKNNDWVKLKSDDVMDALGITRSTVYLAINDLRDMGLLAVKPGRNHYWVNTYILYNGSRITYIKEVAPGLINITNRRKIYR
jgi:hypothetical protein